MVPGELCNAAVAEGGPNHHDHRVKRLFVPLAEIQDSFFSGEGRGRIVEHRPASVKYVPPYWRRDIQRFKIRRAQRQDHEDKLQIRKPWVMNVKRWHTWIT
jgi:hypothetical protein